MTPARKRRGRPRSQDRIELAAALIQRHDALAAREARRIRDILETHVPAYELAPVWNRERERIAERLRRVPGELAPLVVSAVESGRSVPVTLDEHVRSLTDLAADPTPAPRLSPRPAVFCAPREPLEPSRSVAQARARVARLQAQRMELQALAATGTARWRAGRRP